MNREGNYSIQGKASLTTASDLLQNDVKTKGCAKAIFIDECPLDSDDWLDWYKSIQRGSISTVNGVSFVGTLVFMGSKLNESIYNPEYDCVAHLYKKIVILPIPYYQEVNL